ncbi:MotA/TolQ/ExbB proton channel family protein [Anaerocolumna sp.]|uniref:MotA/TolQ/ExbB proton channel family protein n=1 Tax=Anaerocolumna sp. TaxID=2041569 RepID=UPI0028AF23D7|nr:MotA/TolQ/ExbB proton channel family protein [Anaerocolumna sp.]
MSFTLNEILHETGQILLIPCLAILVFFIIASIWEVGTVIVEFLVEHRKMQEDVPLLLQNIHNHGKEELGSLIENSKLLQSQKSAALELIKNADMPKESLVALARTLLGNLEGNYMRNTRLTDYIIKLGPMFGLLGTLIPLGPGIVALGQGDTGTLSISMSTAFDTTIAGVITGAVCFVVSKIRKRWYDTYIDSMEAIMECIIQEVLEND